MEMIENIVALGLSAYNAGRYSNTISLLEHGLAALAYISRSK